MSRKRHTAADEMFFLVRTAAGTFDDGHTIPFHAHSWSQLIYATAGVVTVRTDDGVWVVPPHWAVWAPANAGHALRFTGRTSLRTLYVREGLTPAVTRSMVVAVSPLLRELILRAVDLEMLDGRNATHEALARLIVLELHQHPAAALQLPQPRSEILRRVSGFLSTGSAANVSHRMLARRFGVSVRTLERGFLRETGLSLGRWRRHVRFQHALERLGAGAPVKQAALDAGYRSSSAFIAAFRSALEMTPARYFSRLAVSST